MNFIRTSRNIAIIALLLSLLFHSSSILYIFSQKTRNSSHIIFEQQKDNQPINKSEQQKNNTEWVETHAREGNFGAPVYFEDLPDDSVDTLSEPSNETVTNETETIDTQEINTDAHKNRSDRTQEQIPQQEEKQNAAATHFVAEQPTKQLIQKEDHPQRKKTTRTKMQQSTHHAPKPPLTLAQLTQGFLHQRKEHAGSYGISMLGMKHGIPSDEQMKYERYLQKLSWCLQSAFNIHAHRMPAFSTDTSIYLLFSLARDGTLQQLVVQKSSGNTFLDNFVVFVFRDASVSFPPVPGYLPDDPFQMRCIIPLRIMRY